MEHENIPLKRAVSHSERLYDLSGKVKVRLVQKRCE